MIEQFKVLSHINGKASVSVSELSERFGEPTNRMAQQMQMLEMKGYIEIVGANAEDPAYKLTDEGQKMVGSPVIPKLGD